VGVARALIIEPRIILADERPPRTTMLRNSLVTDLRRRLAAATRFSLL
jgi:ABC-type methionine transport system ATPase subunit